MRDIPTNGKIPSLAVAIGVPKGGAKPGGAGPDLSPNPGDTDDDAGGSLTCPECGCKMKLSATPEDPAAGGAGDEAAQAMGGGR